MTTAKKAKIHMIISRFAESPTESGWYRLLERALEIEFTDESIPRDKRVLMSKLSDYFHELRANAK